MGSEQSKTLMIYSVYGIISLHYNNEGKCGTERAVLELYVAIVTSYRVNIKIYIHMHILFITSYYTFLVG